VYFCPTHPEHGIGRYRVESDLRKPGPGMLLQAARELDIDLTRSVLVGDMPSDIEAGLAAGVGTNFFLGDHGGTDGVGCRAVDRLLDIIPYFLAADAGRDAGPAAG
jgi:D-glycero-D-manno-heptose 1,7-bisphosphate phosphatase